MNKGISKPACIVILIVSALVMGLLTYLLYANGAYREYYMEFAAGCITTVALVVSVPLGFMFIKKG